MKNSKFKKPIGTVCVLLFVALGACGSENNSEAISQNSMPNLEVHTSNTTNDSNLDNRGLNKLDSASGPTNQPIEMLQASGSESTVRYTYGNEQEYGISVHGTGEILIQPDIAKIHMTIEARETTVSKAVKVAADGMERLVDLAKTKGIADNDISTTSFNIYPQQIWKEVRHPSGTYSVPEIVAYVVSNAIQIKVRNLEEVGPVVDTAAEKTGDLLRVDNIEFGINDPSQYTKTLRELAVEDAIVKARQYADALGIRLGPMVFLVETGNSGPAIGGVDGLERAFARSSTPIMPGDTTLTAHIQAVFAINGN